MKTSARASRAVSIKKASKVVSNRNPASRINSRVGKVASRAANKVAVSKAASPDSVSRI